MRDIREFKLWTRSSDHVSGWAAKDKLVGTKPYLVARSAVGKLPRAWVRFALSAATTKGRRCKVFVYKRASAIGGVKPDRRPKTVACSKVDKYLASPEPAPMACIRYLQVRQPDPYLHEKEAEIEKMRVILTLPRRGQQWKDDADVRSEVSKTRPSRRAFFRSTGTSNHTGFPGVYFPTRGVIEKQIISDVRRGWIRKLYSGQNTPWRKALARRFPFTVKRPFPDFLGYFGEFEDMQQSAQLGGRQWNASDFKDLREFALSHDWDDTKRDFHPRPVHDLLPSIPRPNPKTACRRRTASPGVLNRWLKQRGAIQ